MHHQFLQKYSNTSSEKKLAFLAHILSANQELQQQFLEYIEQQPRDHQVLSIEDFTQLIIKYQEEIANKLQEIDLENPDWDNYTPSHSGYMKDWEAYEDASEQELQVELDLYQEKAVDHLIGQKLDTLYAILCGLYLACRDTKIEDPVPTFDSVNDHLLGVLPYTFREIIEKIDYAILLEERLRQVILLILDYSLQLKKDDPEFLKAIQPPIQALVKKVENIDGILDYFKKPAQIGELFPRIYSSLLEASNDHEQWLSFAKKSYSQDPEIAKQLLLYYHKEKDQKHFGTLARELFSSDEYQWAPFLKPLVGLHSAKSLYLDVHLHLIKFNSDLEIFQKIRPELSSKQVDHLIDELWDKKILVQILKLEKRYEDIRQLVKDNYVDHDFVDIITPILNIYPDYCFRTIKKLVYKQLENERGRSVYRRIVQKLQLARQIKGFEEKSEKLIRNVYQYNNRLIALKDEMQIGRLI